MDGCGLEVVDEDDPDLDMNVFRSSVAAILSGTIPSRCGTGASGWCSSATANAASPDKRRTG
jgi:hypothetical protein